MFPQQFFNSSWTVLTVLEQFKNKNCWRTLEQVQKGIQVLYKVLYHWATRTIPKREGTPSPYGLIKNSSRRVQEEFKNFSRTVQEHWTVLELFCNSSWTVLEEFLNFFHCSWTVLELFLNSIEQFKTWTDYELFLNCSWTVFELFQLFLNGSKTVQEVFKYSSRAVHKLFFNYSSTVIEQFWTVQDVNSFWTVLEKFLNCSGNVVEKFK